MLKNIYATMYNYLKKLILQFKTNDMNIKRLFRKHIQGTGALMAKSLLETSLEARKSKIERLALYGESYRKTAEFASIQFTEVLSKFLFHCYKSWFFIK